MELQEGIEIVKRAIRKVIPQDIEVDEKQNLLECMGALDLFYVVSFWWKSLIFLGRMFWKKHRRK